METHYSGLDSRRAAIQPAIAQDQGQKKGRPDGSGRPFLGI